MARGDAVEEIITKKAEEKLREQTPSFTPRGSPRMSVIRRARERSPSTWSRSYWERGLAERARLHRAKCESCDARGRSGLA